VLEEQRLLLGVEDAGCEAAEQAPEEAERDEGPLVAARPEVGPDARAQVLRLADVDHPPLLVLHDVDAGRGWYAREELLVHRQPGSLFYIAPVITRSRGLAELFAAAVTSGVMAYAATHPTPLAPRPPPPPS